MDERRRGGPRQVDIESLPVVESNLLRKEHVAYCLGIHHEIGDRQKLIYYKIGSDVSTPLLTTNATEIIGIDSKVVFGEHSLDYPHKYWDIVDQRPTLSPDAIGVLKGDLSVRDYLLPKEKVDMFNEDLDDRKRRGYWNTRASLQFGNDRLLFIELKKLGVNPRSIKIATASNFVTEVDFNWAFPGEKSKARRITYVPQHLVGETRKDIVRILKGADCYYQKGQRSEDTLAIVQDVQYFLKDPAVVAIGYQFESNKKNPEYHMDLQRSLGHWYETVDISRYDTFIDKIHTSINDSDFEENKVYGMKMHIFERKQYPVRNFRHNFGGARHF